MAGQEPRTVRSHDRLPPGQHEVRNFPVLDLGIQPDVPLEQWRLKIHGHVENPVTLTWEDFKTLPQFKDVSDFHCVTTWSQYDMAFEGVSFFTIADLVRPKSSASHVFFKSYDGYSTNNPLDACMDDDVLIAHSWNNKPISKEHGGPARVIIPKRYAWKRASLFAKSPSSTAIFLASGRCVDIRMTPIRGWNSASPRTIRGSCRNVRFPLNSAAFLPIVQGAVECSLIRR